MKQKLILSLALFAASFMSMNAQVIIGSQNPPHEGAVLELDSDSKGLLLPRVALTGKKDWTLGGSAVNGMMVFNTGNTLEKGIYVWMDGKWVYVVIGCAAPEVSISSDVDRGSIGEGDEVTLTVNATGEDIADATYQWYENGVIMDGKTDLTYTIASVNLNTSYTCKVTTDCGTGSASWSICGAYLDNKVWLSFMCHNLGADESLDPLKPAAGLHGAKYKFGAKEATLTMAEDQATSVKITDWTSTSEYPYQNDSEDWSTANNPCPDGWRLPTDAEWTQIIDTNNNDITNEGGDTWTGGADNYETGKHIGNALFLPAAGLRNYNNGALHFRGSYGSYWSGTVRSGGDGYTIDFNSSSTSVTYYGRTYGRSVRCVTE